MPVVEPGGVRVTTIVTARIVPGGELQLGHGGGRRQLCFAGGLDFCGGIEMELVGWIAAVFRVINKGASYTVVKLNQCERRVQHTEWEGRKGKQSPDGIVSEFPVRQVENSYNTVWPPVGNIMVLYMSPKLGQRRWGCPFCGHALCW